MDDKARAAIYQGLAFVLGVECVVLYVVAKKQGELLTKSNDYARRALELAEDGALIMHTMVEVLEPTPEQNKEIDEKVDLQRWENSLTDVEIDIPFSR